MFYDELLFNHVGFVHFIELGGCPISATTQEQVAGCPHPALTAAAAELMPPGSVHGDELDLLVSLSLSSL